MTDELFEEMKKVVAKKFQVKFMNPANGENESFDIALMYTKFILDEYGKLLDGIWNDTR